MDTTIETPRRRARRRRGQGGSTFKRSNGWQVVYRVNGKQKYLSGFASKDRAREALNAILRKINDGTYVEAKPQLFAAFCDERLAAAKRDLKPSTWGSYRSAADRWLKPYFGRWEVRDITRRDVQQFVDQLRAQKLSRKFVKNVLILLHRLFEEAIDMEVAASNPAHRIKLPEADSEERHVPKPQDVVRTFAELPSCYQVLLATAAMTGARRGELLGLQWQDIDWERGLVHISRTLQRVTKKHIPDFDRVRQIANCGLVLASPKSKKSKRRVELSPKLTALLRTLRQSQPDGEFVFQGPLGGPLDPDGIYPVLQAAQAAAGVARFGLHGLRHLYCSMLQEAGAPVKYAQEQMGHASATTTMDTYTHTITDEGQKYAAAMEAALPFVGGLLTATVQ